MSAYLTLIQNGMSAAYRFKMYRPLQDKAFDQISGLFIGLRKNMQGISRKVFVIASVVIPAYSLLLSNKGVSFLSTVLILAIISIRLVAPYFVTLPERCLIDIKEKNYLVNWVEGIKDSFSLAFEIVLIQYTNLPLPVILSFNLVWLVITKFIYLYLIKRNYGEQLNRNAKPDHSPSGMTKDVLTHQIASIATSNTDAVTLSIFRHIDKCHDLQRI